ncbi:MAG TPA: amino acid adenylation domain-containing protein, partial [Candidatus Angelobacter sp.]
MDNLRTRLEKLSPSQRSLLELRKAKKQRIPALRPAKRVGPLPTSFAQQRLWFAHQLQPNSSAYNVSSVLRLKGELKVELLERAMVEIVRRHEVLRTRFENVGGDPRQIIEAESRIGMPVVDLSGQGMSEREAEVRKQTQEESEAPFDLGRGPLLRVKLLKLAEQEHVLLVTMHHIVSDGWSMGIMVHECAELYQAYSEGRDPGLAELPIQYGDYAVWQREWMKGEVLEEQLGYWRKQLAGVGVLELATDRVRPALQTNAGAILMFALKEELSAGLKELSRREGVTLFMTLLGAFQAMLWRYSGQGDIAVGAPIAGRRWKEIEGLIGFFVNTLVLRTKVKGGESFKELLEGVRETTLEAYRHQDVPFEKLVEELQPERKLNTTPLFQVMFVLQNAPPGEVRLAGLTLSDMPSETSIERKFDLSLETVEYAGKIEASLRYRTELFDEITMRRMAGHWETLLQGIVQDSTKAVSCLPILSLAEWEQVVVEWNQTETEYPPAHVHELFEAHALQRPDAVAVVHEQEQLTYAALNRQANQLGHYLRKLGVGPEVRVGVCLERNLDTVVAVLGILKAGGAYVPLDPGYPQERLRYMVEHTEMRLLVAQQSVLDGLSISGVMGTSLEAVREMIEGEPGKNLDGSSEGANLAYILFTSGSTGRPKGVAVEHRQLQSYVQAVVERLELSGHLSFALVQPLTVDSSVTTIFGALCTGGTLHVISRDKSVDAMALREYFEQHRIDYLKCAPSHLAALHAATEEEKIVPKRCLVVGGEASRLEWVQHLLSIIPETCKLFNHYGPTETAVGVLTHRVEKTCEDVSGVTPLGRPLGNSRAYVLDEHGQLAPVGVCGELYIGGANVVRGYWNGAEVTAEKFVPDAWSGGWGERLYGTGDQVRYRSQGEIEYLGRKDEQVKIRGYRIELGEIEAVLLEREELDQCVVVAREDKSGEKRLVAYVVVKAEADKQGLNSRLREHAKSKLPEFMAPSAYALLESLPLSEHGKLDRKRLPEVNWEVGEESREKKQVGPGTVEEEILCGIWEAVLGVKKVGTRDNFFRLGGHSLLATQVMARVRSSFGVEVPLRKLFEEQTVEGLAECVRKAREVSWDLGPVLERVGREEGLPLSYAQQRLWFLDQLTPGSAAYNMPFGVRLKGELK